MRTVSIPELIAYGLTGAEARVGELVLKGMSNKEVAQALFLSPKTSKFHCTAIYKKFGVKSRSEFIAKFFAKRAFPDEPLPSGIN